LRSRSPRTSASARGRTSPRRRPTSALQCPAYNADHATGYTGATLTKLQGSYDAGIKNIKISVANSTTYCIVNTVPGTVFYHKSGPGADIKAGHC
jgi:hypothetical protein